MLATPLPCRITRASSFCDVECQPTLSPCFSLTDPPLIPLVCGAPLRSGQSPPVQSSGKVVGPRVVRSCAAMLPNAKVETRTRNNFEFVMGHSLTAACRKSSAAEAVGDRLSLTDVFFEIGDSALNDLVQFCDPERQTFRVCFFCHLLAEFDHPPKIFGSHQLERVSSLG